MSENALLQLIALVRRRQLKLGLAESCTGGLLSSQITAIAGVSDIYQGAVISYSNEAKLQILGVSEHSLQKYGAVSEQVAIEMARGASRMLNAQCAVAITGIAGPTGGTPDKSVGTVFMAVLGPGFVKCERQIFPGDRTSIQQQSAEFTIKLLLNALQQDDGQGI